MKETPSLGVIGGSGVYAMPGLTDTQLLEITTPFGTPSSSVVHGKLDGVPVVFLARHGLGHFISPSEINYRANIYALKLLGVQQIVSISACGSLREDFAPGDIVIPDQIFDFTKDRKRSFFEDGLVAHISVADPFCPELSKQLFEAVIPTGVQVHQGGSLVTIEGPRFSTKAESNIYRSWGMSVIGMTTAPEAFLAREAEMCYTVMAHVTDYDVWHVSELPVTVDMVVETLKKNTEAAQQAIRNLVRDLKPSNSCACDKALATAFITHQEAIPPDTLKRLDLLVGKYLG